MLATMALYPEVINDNEKKGLRHTKIFVVCYGIFIQVEKDG